MLYVVATPIGNLSDITLRAIETLKQSSIIIAENPLHTKKLLDHYEIKGKKLIQFAEHNEQKVLPGIVSQLASQDASLVTDAGTPGISDPGFRLVRACVGAGIEVVSIPGANAATTALVASGLPTDKYIFFGFAPKTEPKLIRMLEEAKTVEATAVYYESPQRISKTAAWVAKKFPKASVAVARELSKIHEEFIRGTSEQVSETLKSRKVIRGEITVLVSFK